MYKRLSMCVPVNEHQYKCVCVCVCDQQSAV